MKVSIIIPIFNSEKTISETVESIKKQDYNDLEIIFVNDGSSDNSSTIVKELIKELKFNSLYIETSNNGPSKARNLGVENATGDYIVFLDADDLIASNYISKAIEIFKLNENINLVYGNVELFGDEIGKWQLQEFGFPNFLLENCIPIFAMHKKSHFLELEGFDMNLNFAEDWDLWIRLIKRYGGVYKINETVYYYRKHSENNSLTDIMKKENKIDLARLYIFNKHYHWYTENGLSITNLVHNSIHLRNYKNKNLTYKLKKIFGKIL